MFIQLRITKLWDFFFTFLSICHQHELIICHGHKLNLPPKLHWQPHWTESCWGGLSWEPHLPSHFYYCASYDLSKVLHNCVGRMQRKTNCKLRLRAQKERRLRKLREGVKLSIWSMSPLLLLNMLKDARYCSKLQTS